MAIPNKLCPLNFLKTREYQSSQKSWNPIMTCSTFLSNRLDYSTSLYRRDLFSHFGCVNAIEFSDEGCLLISGGDDRRVLLWNLESSISEGFKPTPMKEEHSSNIFCMSFDSSNLKIFSAGNDEQVIVHDIETTETVNVFAHDEAVYGVSGNPHCDAIFASAGEDGRVLLCDTRIPRSEDPVLLARSYHPFHAVQFHPVEPKLIVTANPKDGVVVWDLRKPLIPFLKYGDRKSPESSMSARFNSDGSQIIALRRRLPPILFNTHSAAPVCQFDSDHYYNSCTMKSCCFAGSRDQFVLSGSDDFNLYMWRIPEPDSDVKFIGDAHMVLRGHRSIVNQVRFNPHNFTIASSGVEKIVKLWSPVPVPGSDGALETDDRWMTRKVYTHEEYIGLVLDSGQNVSHDYSNGSTAEDPRMMAFFDSLVQREVEGWTTNTDDEDHTSTPSSSNQQSDDSETDSSSSSSRHETSTLHPLPVRRILRRSTRGGPTVSGKGTWKPAPGSEWILRLIAKKRAQLRAAKRRRKRTKKRLKSRKFIRSLSTQHKQYSYRPQALRTTEPSTSLLNPVDTCLRLPVAPYTYMGNMSLNNFLDSDQEEDEDSEDATAGPSGIGSMKTKFSSSDLDDDTHLDNEMKESFNKKRKRFQNLLADPITPSNSSPSLVSTEPGPPPFYTKRLTDDEPPNVTILDCGVSTSSVVAPDEMTTKDKKECKSSKGSRTTSAMGTTSLQLCSPVSNTIRSIFQTVLADPYHSLPLVNCEATPQYYTDDSLDKISPITTTPDSGVSSASATTPESWVEDKSEAEDKTKVSFKKVPQCRLNKYRPRANDSD